MPTPATTAPATATTQAQPRPRTYALASALVALAVTFALLPGTPRAEAAAAQLQVSPGPTQIVGGSRLTLTGHLGVTGRRAVVVEQHMGRVGDSWKTRPETRGQTRADGSFTLHVTASAMWGFRYRVRGGTRVTPAVTTYAKAQDVIVTQTSRGAVGQPLEFLVDTVGRGYSGYRELPAPVLEGRTLTLQRRVSPTAWEDVATTRVGADGLATVGTTHRRAGDVYRVRAEDWRGNGDVIGWTASFPHVVSETPGRVKAGTHLRTTRSPVTSQAITEAPRTAKKKQKKSDGGRRHAHSTYGWFGRDGVTQRWEWELGESLDSAAMQVRGSSRAANRWSEGSDGTGRVTLRNGGMLLRSEGYGSAPDGARGNVWAALTGSGERRGRWEVRGVTTPGGGGQAHAVRYELVPLAQAHQLCGTAGIVIGESKGPGSPLRIGARAGDGTTWGRTVGTVPSGPSSYAVQVTGKHLTWFVNGTPVATLRQSAALPTGPMALRVVMAGRHDTAMASTKSTVDWARTFSLKRGTRPTSRTGLTQGAAHGGC